MRCSSPAELDRSNERRVDQDVVSNRDQGAGGQPTDKSTFLRSAMWARMWFSNRAMCPLDIVHHHSSLSLVHHHLPLSKSQIALSDMHHPAVFGIIFLPHSVNLRLIHHLSQTSHHPLLPLSSIPDLKLTCSTNPSHNRSSSYPPDCPLDFNRTAFTDFVPPCVMF